MHPNPEALFVIYKATYHIPGASECAIGKKGSIFLFGLVIHRLFHPENIFIHILGLRRWQGGDLMITHSLCCSPVTYG